MREDLCRPEGGGSAEVTAVSKEVSSWHVGWEAVSSIIWSAGKAAAGGIVHGEMLASWLGEAEMASGISGRGVEGEMSQDRLHHQSRVHDKGEGHVRGQPSLTGPWNTQRAWDGMMSCVTENRWPFHVAEWRFYGYNKVAVPGSRLVLIGTRRYGAYTSASWLWN